jgi:hypothetical protein
MNIESISKITIEMKIAEKALNNIYSKLSEQTKLSASETYLLAGLKATQCCLSLNIETIQQITNRNTLGA